MAKPLPIEITNWNMGGLADSKWSGTKDTLFKLVGLDMHSEPAVLKTEQKLTKETTGTTPDELCKWTLQSSNGRTYAFSSESGKIWERPSNGTWALVHTTTPAAGEAKCLGAIEFQGYIIWATESRLHRILATDAEGSGEWTANVSEDWQTFTVTNTDYHPMVEQNLNLYIGDGNQVSEWDGTTFTATALDIKTPLVIKSLGKWRTDILIGTIVDDNITETEILRWNTWSVSFSSTDPIKEVGINAFLPADNFVYVSAGKVGNIYIYDGEKLELFKKVQGSYSASKTCVVHPNAVANFNGQVLFGVSNDSGNPCLQGVYRFGRHSRNYPWILDMPYPISERSGSDFVTSGIEIGSITVVGQKILVAWQNGSTKGVDLLDTSNKLNGAYFETRVMRPDRLKQTMWEDFELAYNELPASTALAITKDANYAGSYSALGSSQVQDSDRNVLRYEERLEATTLQLKCVFTTNSNDTPSLESLFVYPR